MIHWFVADVSSVLDLKEVPEVCELDWQGESVIGTRAACGEVTPAAAAAAAAALMLVGEPACPSIGAFKAYEAALPSAERERGGP